MNTSAPPRRNNASGLPTLLTDPASLRELHTLAIQFHMEWLYFQFILPAIQRGSLVFQEELETRPLILNAPNGSQVTISNSYDVVSYLLSWKEKLTLDEPAIPGFQFEKPTLLSDESTLRLLRKISVDAKLEWMYNDLIAPAYKDKKPRIVPYSKIFWKLPDGTDYIIANSNDAAAYLMSLQEGAKLGSKSGRALHLLGLANSTIHPPAVLAARYEPADPRGTAAFAYSTSGSARQLQADERWNKFYNAGVDVENMKQIEDWQCGCCAEWNLFDARRPVGGKTVYSQAWNVQSGTPKRMCRNCGALADKLYHNGMVIHDKVEEDEIEKRFQEDKYNIPNSY